MTFPIPPQIWAERPITSIWTDFTNAYDGKTLIGSYPAGAPMNDWTLLSSANASVSFQVDSAPGSISGQAFHLVGGSNLNNSTYFTWDYIPAASDLDVLVGVKPVVLVPGSTHAGAMAHVIQPAPDDPVQYRTAFIQSGGAPLLSSSDTGGSDGASISNTVTAGQWYWLRLNIAGDAMKAKFWLRSDPEPSGWMNTLDTARAASPGGVGLLFNRRITSESLIDFFSVSLDGSPAYAPGL